jgi:hypothetical protein
MARIVVSTVEKAYLKVILVSGLVVGVLDGLNAIIIYKLVLDFNPIPIYQFVASGMLGPKAYEGGMATALLGLGVHFLVAFSSSASYLSGYLALEVGDVVLTGTPEGVGLSGRFPYLSPGDVVRVEIDGLGRQTQQLVGDEGQEGSGAR